MPEGCTARCHLRDGNFELNPSSFNSFLNLLGMQEAKEMEGCFRSILQGLLHQATVEDSLQ